MSLSHSTQALFKLHSSALLFGLAGLFGRWLSLSPFIIVLGRVFFASIALILILKVSKQSLLFLRAKDLYYFIGLGFLLAFHWYAFFEAIQVSTLAIALFSIATFPLFTFLLELIFFRLPFRWLNLVLVLISVYGLYLVVPVTNWQESAKELQGLFWGLASALSFAVLSLVNRALGGRYTSWQISFHQDFWACIFLLPSLYFINFSVSLKDLSLLILLGFVFTALAHSLYIASLKEIKASTASLVIAMEPVYGVIAAFIFFSELPSGRTIIGGIIILAVSLYISLDTKRSLRKAKKAALEA